jgi:hypothetical protein
MNVLFAAVHESGCGPEGPSCDVGYATLRRNIRLRSEETAGCRGFGWHYRPQSKTHPFSGVHVDQMRSL